MSVWRHVRAIVLLPGVVTLVVPAIIVLPDDANPGWGLPAGVAVLPTLAGAAVIAVGLLLWANTVRLFATVGRGTLAPWDPTQRLVIRGPYRHVRNPMISGVLFVLLGEAALLGSTGLLVWFGAFFVINAVYMPLVEEPGLSRRFGDEYELYKAHVPRWVPRPRAWEPPEH